MGSSHNPAELLEYLDLDLEIGKGQGRHHPVAILQSPAGEARGTMRFPFDQLALDNHLKALELSVVRSVTPSGRSGAPDANTVQGFGQALMDSVLAGSLRSTFDQSITAAKLAGKRLRLRLRILDPELATLPWEFLYDAGQREFAVLSRNLSLVRYLELPSAAPSLMVEPPLHILAMASGPSDLPALDASNERQRLATAVAGLVAAGLVEVTWMESGSWRELQHQLRGGPWHVFHYIGHGGYEAAIEEGVLAFVGDDGKAQFLRASQVGRLLADHDPLRLIVLNSCEGAEGSSKDLVSSTAATLVERGIPAVIGMRYEITDQAAIEFSRGLYEAIADELPVDAAVSEARIGLSMALQDTLEWGTPVVFMRAAEGALFQISLQS